MRLTVEFLGLARRLAQTKQVRIEMDEPATIRDVVRRLAADYPPLVGPVIVPEIFETVPSYMINVDGRAAVRDYDARPKEGECLIFMFVEAGG